jgi:hypothetical protein
MMNLFCSSPLIPTINAKFFRQRDHANNSLHSDTLTYHSGKTSKEEVHENSVWKKFFWLTFTLLQTKAILESNSTVYSDDSMQATLLEMKHTRTATF